MLKHEYIHAINALNKRKRELENELIIIEKEKKVADERYIHTSSKGKIGDRVKYCKHTFYLLIHNIHTRRNGDIFYDIGNETEVIVYLVHENDLIIIDDDME